MGEPMEEDVYWTDIPKQRNSDFTHIQESPRNLNYLFGQMRNQKR